MDSKQKPGNPALYPLLKSIKRPSDLRPLDLDQLKQLAEEIRHRLISVTSVNGGHLGPNLGVVELSIALHLVFDSPRDHFVFDTSHQGYVHKLLTGRDGPAFEAIRTSKGLSGFLAREESEHLALVVRVLQRRGGQLSRQHRNAYAAGLRQHVRLGEGPNELLDRLMVSALIELRSCERFGVLAEGCEDEELSKLYRGLYASELGHFEVFLELAQGALGMPDASEAKPAGDPIGREVGEVGEAWDRWLDIEAELIQAQPVGSHIHSGPPGAIDRRDAGHQ